MKENERVDLKLKEAREMTHYLSAFTNEKRVQITILLSGKKEMNVGSIARALNMPQSSVSLHLEKLFTRGAVERKKIGKNVYYRINEKNINHIIKLLTHYFTNKKPYKEAVLWHHYQQT